MLGGTSAGPVDGGLNPDRWEVVTRLVQNGVAAGRWPEIAVETGSASGPAGTFSGGTQSERLVESGGPPVFLTASLTKPVVAMGILKLLEQGHLRLHDRVSDLVPEFGGTGRYPIEVRHLLTHTSGLPDLLPNDRVLRGQNAPLSEFLAELCQCKPAFPAGRGVQYQSSGFILLAEILQRLTQVDPRAWLAENLFEPLKMRHSWLGLPLDQPDARDRILPRLIPVVLPKEQVGHDDWNWNSDYWRQLGAPWGGLFSTTCDLGRLAQSLLRGGRTATGTNLWSPATVAVATCNQLATMREIPDVDRRTRPWGLGWRLNWRDTATFGDLLGPRAYGHWGATGTLMWIDPDPGIYAVILANQPWDDSGPAILRLSNAIRAAWV
jgi:CubicO group peptidase (beta-lactamase class C family)